MSRSQLSKGGWGAAVALERVRKRGQLCSGHSEGLEKDGVVGSQGGLKAGKKAEGQTTQILMDQ
jgi:hypothetical protein